MGLVTRIVKRCLSPGCWLALSDFRSSLTMNAERRDCNDAAMRRYISARVRRRDAKAARPCCARRSGIATVAICKDGSETCAVDDRATSANRPRYFCGPPQSDADEVRGIYPDHAGDLPVANIHPLHHRWK